MQYNDVTDHVNKHELQTTSKSISWLSIHISVLLILILRHLDLDVGPGGGAARGGGGGQLVRREGERRVPVTKPEHVHQS